MSCEVEPEAIRPRPLSAGFRSLLTWLRREEHASIESLSSVGSTRTAISFAYLPPASYGSGPQRALRPPDSPTASYSRRLRERDVRRRLDRGVTLRRKYGLGLAAGDAYSFPGRAVRAASEGAPRRPPYVPGKRPAPPAPASPPLVLAPAPPPLAAVHTDTRRRSAKRPAPPPPPPAGVVIPVKSDSKPVTTMTDRPSDGSFLKKFFESRRKETASPPTATRPLPSISELDRRAVELIENFKSQTSDRGGASSQLKGDDKMSISRKPNSMIANYWFCTRCLKKYDASIDICLRCSYETKTSNDRLSGFKNLSPEIPTTLMKAKKNAELLGVDEKQKLKEMLKEMKDSLPKRPKYDEKSKIIKNSISKISDDFISQSLETPTLRIGYSPKNDKMLLYSGPSSLTNMKNTQTKEINESGKVVDGDILRLKANNENDKTNNENKNIGTTSQNEEIDNKNKQVTKKTDTQDIKISNDASTDYSVGRSSGEIQSKDKTKEEQQNTSVSKFIPSKSHFPAIIQDNTYQVTQSKECNSKESGTKDNKRNSYFMDTNVNPKPKNISLAKEQNINKNNPLPSKVQKSLHIKNDNIQISLHSRKRNLINQLEQSIAQGDEQAAAEAAAKLAQLRLSCSVLSFSSQLPRETSKIVNDTVPDIVKISESSEQKQKIFQTARLNEKQENRVTMKKDKPDLFYSFPPFEIKSSIDAASSSVNAQRTNDTERISIASTSNKFHKQMSACSNIDDKDIVPIDVWIEDREATRGPVQLHVQRNAVIGQLRKEAERLFGVDSILQRWIIGRTLCTDDNVPIRSLSNPDFKGPFYLCLVESETDKKDKFIIKPNENNVFQDDARAKVYLELVQLEKQAIILNTEVFECTVCLANCPVGSGVVLRECLHTFCKECLSDLIRHCEEPTVGCPAIGCTGNLQEREIRSLVSLDDFERWLARGLAAAENSTKNAFHCKTHDCTGWAFCENGVTKFPCPVCKCTNCISCQGIHEGQTCEQYLKTKWNNETCDTGEDGTQLLLDNLISRGEALRCPECKTIITKKWGCDWVKCSACKTEICWVTRGPRWGPGGRGDISAGCRCGVDGKRCHPSCGYCH